MHVWWNNGGVRLEPEDREEIKALHLLWKNLKRGIPPSDRYPAKLAPELRASEVASARPLWRARLDRGDVEQQVNAATATCDAD